GLYELKNGDHLFDLIDRAGGITKNTHLLRAYIFRGAGDPTLFKSQRIEVNLSEYGTANADNTNNIPLEINDVIQLFSNSDFEEEQYVQIFGEIRKDEGKKRYYEGMTLQDLIYLSGGLKPSAEFGRLEISSIIDIDSAKAGKKPTRTIVRSYSINSDLSIDSIAEKILLSPFDQVYVRKNPTFELQKNIRLEGLFKYPGNYSRLYRNERLSSYIERAGGTKEYANLEGTVLYRRKTSFFREKIVNDNKLDSNGKIIKDSMVVYLDDPISIDLMKAMKNKNSSYDIVLQEEDIVYVPEINPFVVIKGRVQSSLRITYDKEHSHLMYYIDKAGGFGINPWRRRIFVTYANGRSRRTRNFGFIHFYPRVREGSTVTVPERPETKVLSNALVQSVTTAIPLIIAAIILRTIK
ncbi:MAG: hypothetical protein HY305_02370, partial [Sphingobacteriales bacterium]|nr:hypothetical protein [Sphingobacteriales bacterium]